MTPVEFHFVLPTGEPLANMAVDIQLARSSITDTLDGITFPRLVTVKTDAEGKVTVALWPSNTMYFVSVKDTASDAELAYKFIVPEVDAGITVRMQDIVVNGAPSSVTWTDAALLSILEAKASAKAYSIAAANSAAEAAASADEAAAHGGSGPVVNDLVTGGATVPGSAQQLVVLKGLIDQLTLQVLALMGSGAIDEPTGTVYLDSVGSLMLGSDFILLA